MMWFSVCMLAVSLLIGALFYQAAQHRPWQPRKGRSAADLLVVGQYSGLRVLWYAAWFVTVVTSVLAVADYPFLMVLLVAATVAVVVRVAAAWLPLRRILVGWCVSVHKKYGAELSIVGKAMRVIGRLGNRLFVASPPYTDEQEMMAYLAYQQRQFAVVPEKRFKRFTALLAAGETPARAFIQPLADMLLVRADDTVGPLLLSQLHETSYPAFAVYHKRRSNVVGIFDIESGVRHAATGSQVQQLMSDKVVQIEESATVTQAIGEFVATGAVLLMVIDDQRKPIGAIYVQDILQQLFAE